MDHPHEPEDSGGTGEWSGGPAVRGTAREQAEATSGAAGSADPPPWPSTRPMRPGTANDHDHAWRWPSTEAEVPWLGQLPPDGTPPPGGPRSVGPTRPRFTWRRLVALGLVLLVLLLTVLDRVAAHLAATEMASQVQKSQHLPTRPRTSVGGFPFLTQVVMGDYQDIGLGIHRVAVSGLCVDDIDVHAKGVRLPLTKLLGGKVTSVRIDQISGAVHLTYADLNAYLAKQPGNLQLAAAGGGLRVSAPVDVPFLGRFDVFGDVRASVQNNRLTISPTSLGVVGLGSVAIPTGAVQALTAVVPLDGLPMNLRLTSATVSSAGVAITAQASQLDLDTTQQQDMRLQAC